MLLRSSSCLLGCGRCHRQAGDRCRSRWEGYKAEPCLEWRQQQRGSCWRAGQRRPRQRKEGWQRHAFSARGLEDEVEGESLNECCSLTSWLRGMFRDVYRDRRRLELVVGRLGPVEVWGVWRVWPRCLCRHGCNIHLVERKSRLRREKAADGNMLGDDGNGWILGGSGACDIGPYAVCCLRVWKLDFDRPRYREFRLSIEPH